MSSSQEIEAQAADWVARRDRDDWSDTDQRDLVSWLNASTAHRVAFLRLESAWRQADRLKALRVPAMPLRTSALAGHRPQSMLARVAAVLLVSILFGGLYVWSSQPPERNYATAVGEHRSVQLADGSTVELNTGTAIRTRVGNGQRDVWLDTGEAYFSVVHDPQHPFVIHSGDRAVTVFGTRFSVRSEPDRFDVLVESGRVGVDSGAARRTMLGAGDVLNLDGGATALTHNSPEQMARLLSWRSGVLVFGQSELADVAAEFNRYNRLKLFVADGKARGIRIGGTFQATNVASFVRLLQSGFGVHLKREGDTIVISE